MKAWETIRELTNRKPSPLSKVKGNAKDEQLKTWYDHFKSLLGPEPPSNPALTFQMITSTEKFQIIFQLILGNLL